MYEPLSSEKQVSAFGTHSIWFIKVNNKYYYISHQSDLLGIGSEAMAFRCNKDGNVTNWNEVAVNFMDDPEEAFKEIVIKLENI